MAGFYKGALFILDRQNLIPQLIYDIPFISGLNTLYNLNGDKNIIFVTTQWRSQYIIKINETQSDILKTNITSKT